MTGTLDADDLALLAGSFGAALDGCTSAAEADARLGELGWVELLAATGRAGAAVTFTVLGASNAPATSLDDVVLRSLGHDPDPGLGVVLPAAAGSAPPGSLDGATLRVRGVVSPRFDRVDRVVVPLVDAAGRHGQVTVEARLLGRADGAATLDPTGLLRSLSVEVPAGEVPSGEVQTGPADGSGGAARWAAAVADARVALAHQLVGVSRWILDSARQHAVDRVQYGRPVASYQAVRHRLVDTLAAIEAAAAVAAVAADPVAGSADPLLAAVARSLAGEAALTAARNGQQVLGGIGFTADHPFHLRLKRLLTLEILFGSAAGLPAEIGRELLARGDAPRLVEV